MLQRENRAGPGNLYKHDMEPEQGRHVNWHIYICIYIYVYIYICVYIYIELARVAYIHMV